MVKIRLTRTGKRHEPHYRIVAVDSRRPRDGKYLEKIGYYNPRTSPPTLDYDKEILQKWIDSGAQMTDTVLDMFVREGVVKQTGKRKARLELITKPEPKETTEEQAETQEEAGKGTPDDSGKKKAPVNEEEAEKEGSEAKEDSKAKKEDTDPAEEDEPADKKTETVAEDQMEPGEKS
jgi:small subunit ribosomal protein S16